MVIDYIHASERNDWWNDDNLISCRILQYSFTTGEHFDQWLYHVFVISVGSKSEFILFLNSQAHE